MPTESGKNGDDLTTELITTRCERGASIARRMGFGEYVALRFYMISDSDCLAALQQSLDEIFADHLVGGKTQGRYKPTLIDSTLKHAQ